MEQFEWVSSLYTFNNIKFTLIVKNKRIESSSVCKGNAKKRERIICKRIRKQEQDFNSNIPFSYFLLAEVTIRLCPKLTLKLLPPLGGYCLLLCIFVEGFQVFIVQKIKMKLIHLKPTKECLIKLSFLRIWAGNYGSLIM